MLFVLNESTKIDLCGDLQLYSSIELLIGYVEAIDVRNNEYFAFTTDGNRIYISASSDSSPVNYVVDETPRNQLDVAKLLSSYLSYFADDGRFNIDPVAVIAASNSLEELVKLIPAKLIQQG